MPSTTQEYVEITALIRGVLNGYPGNSAILREFLANSDDAKATCQTLILDERHFPTSSLVDLALAGSQGPSLLAINDGLIEEHDWTALLKIHSSSKKSDESQTGKNGLGFRASYHLTDNPHILSGRTLMILDPHKDFKEHPGGISLDIVDESGPYRDQLAPFSDLRGSNSENLPYVGTAFRLPLRTKEQAARSKISDAATTPDQLLDIFKDFITSELQRVILFLKHITKIQFKRILANGHVEPLASIEIEELGVSARIGTVLRKVTLTAGAQPPSVVTWCFHHLLVDKEEAATVMSARVEYDARPRMIADKLVAAVDVALPLVSTPPKGGCSTLMPLPVSFDGFPVYLNGVFALDQNRQNFKNIEEVGPVGSRERLLVEWNKTIFDTWAPIGWAKVLASLLSQIAVANMWDFLPSDNAGDMSYRSGLLRHLIEEIDSQNLAIFPTVGRTPDAALLSLRDAEVIIAPPTPGVSLDALIQAGFAVIQPPPHVFSVLQSLPHLALSILSPQLLYSRLLRNFPHILHDDSHRDIKEAIIQYLIFSEPTPHLSHLVGLPLFQLSTGAPFSFQAGSLREKYIIPSSWEESAVFAGNLWMVPCASLSDGLRKVLRLPSSASILNVATLDIDDIIEYLNARFVFAGEGDKRNPEDIATIPWLIRFWTWLVDAQYSSHIFARISKLSDAFLLPTAGQTVRAVSSKIIDFRHLADRIEAVRALAAIGVEPVHTDVPYNVSEKLRSESLLYVPGTPDFILSLLDSCDTAKTSRILNDDRIHLQRFLLDSLPYSTLTLSSPYKNILRALPVYSARKHHDSSNTLQGIDGTHFFIVVDERHPLPALPCGTGLFVDLLEPSTKRMADLVGPSRGNPLNVDGLLLLAVQHWVLQSEGTRDDWVHRFLSHCGRTPSFRSQVADLPFVTVNGLPHRVPPRDLVDPQSRLARLYKDEHGRFPCGHFFGSRLDVMKNLGFVKTRLDAVIVHERLAFFNSSNQWNPALIDKAKVFLELLDRNWDSGYRKLVEDSRNCAWLPLSGDSLGSPVTCRDRHEDNAHSNLFYFDKVWDILAHDIRIGNPAFREALGWSRSVPFETLITQLEQTVCITDGMDRNKRIIALINYFATLDSLRLLSATNISKVRDQLHHRAWVPISRSSTRSIQMNYATSRNLNLPPPFEPIHSDLPVDFLVKLGCSERPTLATLVAEVTRPHALPQNIVAFLQEIAEHHPHVDRQLACIPDSHYPSPLCSLEHIYYNDMPRRRTYTIHGRRAAHDSISRVLAEKLGMDFLSSLSLDDQDVDDDDDDGDEQMAEDLTIRIRGFLRDYDRRFALNEFLANADDAGATRFSILLLQGEVSSKARDAVISPGFESLIQEPALLIFNNASLTAEDFFGLRRIGKGGKQDRQDTHGRYGLGALSAFYFTDVVTVISGDHVLILDPTGQYLPPRQRQRRTAYKKRLSFILEHYPDQLRRCYSQFGFQHSASDAADARYNGTIFLCPLKAGISEKSCNFSTTTELVQRPYRELAHNAFFFTRLCHISANIQSGWDNRHGSPTWSFDGSRTQAVTQDDHVFQTLTVRDEVGTSEEWTIATSRNNIHPTHATVAASLKLSGQMIIQLAVRFEPSRTSTEDPTSYLFSTFQLPKKVSLPFHANARFAISSNRQDVVFYPADSHNQIDPKTAFNTWIMEGLFPPLYLACLSYRVHHVKTTCSSQFSVQKRKWWLKESKDDTAKLVRQGLLGLLPSSDVSLFLTADSVWTTFSEGIFSNNEPSSVTDILLRLKAPGLVCGHDSRRTGLADAASQVVTPEYVQSFLSSRVSLYHVEELCLSAKVPMEALFKVMDYLCEPERIVPLHGLPILVLTTGELASVPSSSNTALYYTDHSEIHELFASSKFISTEYGKRPACNRLLSSPNIIQLEGQHISRLVVTELSQGRSADERRRWIDRFWTKFSLLPGPPSLDELEREGLELFRIKGRSEFISLSDCLPTNVIYGPRLPGSSDRLQTILRLLDIVVIGRTGNIHVDSIVNKRFPNYIDNILQCLEVKGVASRVRNLSIEDRTDLAEILRMGIESSVPQWQRQPPPISRSFLMKLPIWRAYSRTSVTLESAERIEVVVVSVENMRHIQPYLQSSSTAVLVTSQCHALQELLRYCNRMSKQQSSQPADLYRLLDLLTLPIRLESQVDHSLYRNFLAKVLSLPLTMMPTQLLRQIVPDTNGNLKQPSELYDHTVDLFRIVMALQPEDTPALVHPNVRDLVPALRRVGLIHEIDFNTFNVCASTLDDAVQRRVLQGVTINDCLAAAEVLFHVYQTTITTQVVAARQTHSNFWSNVDRISFIRRQDIARRGLTYDLPRLFHQDQPLIVSPSNLVRTTFEPIAWTQRMLFRDEPEQLTLMINENLGVPTVAEVVRHLIVLTTEIAPFHPGNAMLLSDIKATYKYLDENAETAREHLLLAAQDQLFLNVDDPINDPWEGQWCKADELILNLEYDHRSLKSVRKLLQSYDKLLSAAGSLNLDISGLASAQSLSRTKPEAESTHLQRWNTLNAMRKVGELTDMVFMPSDVPADLSELRAHRCVLASVVPHMRDALKGWNLGENGEFRFYGSAFGAKAILNYIYTGELGLPDAVRSVEETTIMLRDLLELLEVANRWSMTDLKEEVQHHVIVKYRMVQRMPHMFSEIMTTATEHGADTLRRYLEEFAHSNPKVIRELQADA